MQPAQKGVNESADERTSLLLHDSTEEGIHSVGYDKSYYSSGSNEESLLPDDYEITEKFEMV